MNKCNTGERSLGTLPRKSPAEAHKPFANYSHVVTAQGATNWSSALARSLPIPPARYCSRTTSTAQTKMVIENLKLALAEGGASLKDMVKVTIYICNPHDVPKARSILQEYFGDDPPASTLCVLRGLANPNFFWRSKQSQQCEMVCGDECPLPG